MGSLKRNIEHQIGRNMLQPEFKPIDSVDTNKRTRIELKKAMLGYNNSQSRTETKSMNKLFEPFRTSFKHNVSCIDSGNESYSGPANNTFSLNRQRLTKPFEQWKNASNCDWFPDSIIKQRKARGGFVPGDLIFVIKNYKGEKHRKESLFVSFPEINRAFNVRANAEGTTSLPCKEGENCPVCPRKENGKLNLAKLTANFHPVGIVMQENRPYNQTTPYTIATDGEIHVHDYWRSLQIDEKDKATLNNKRELNPERTNRLAHSPGETLFIGCTNIKNKLYFQPVTGKTFEYLLKHDVKKESRGFWAIGRIINSASDKQMTNFNMTGIGENDKREISPGSPLYSYTFATITLQMGLLLREQTKP